MYVRNPKGAAELGEQQKAFLRDARYLLLADLFNGPKIAPLVDRIRAAAEKANMLPPAAQNYMGVMQVVAAANLRQGPESLPALIMQCLGHDQTAAQAFATVMGYRRAIGPQLEMIRGEYSGVRLEALSGPIEAHALEHGTDAHAAERANVRQNALDAMQNEGGYTKFAAEEVLRNAERQLRAIAEDDYGLPSLAKGRL